MLPKPQVILTYNRKYDSLWQVVDCNMDVIATYRTRVEALKRLELFIKEQTQCP